MISAINNTSFTVRDQGFFVAFILFEGLFFFKAISACFIMFRIIEILCISIKDWYLNE